MVFVFRMTRTCIVKQNYWNRGSTPLELLMRRSKRLEIHTDLAVLTTFGVITGLCGCVICSSGSSHGITSSIWYFKRRATRVTSRAGIADEMLVSR